MNNGFDGNKGIRFVNSVVHSTYENLIIVANVRNGMSFKMTKECFDILNAMIEKKASLDEFWTWFEEDDDKKYFQRILEVLLAYGIAEYVEENKLEGKYTIIFVLTNRCNLKCNHCCVSATFGEGNEAMSLEDWKQVIDKLQVVNLKEVIFTGGEPLVRSDFFEIVAYAKERLKCSFSLMTNGTLINVDNAKRLVNIFDNFSFSLDGISEETCAPVRGKGVFERAMKGIEIMKSEGMKSFSLSLTRVKQNAHCIMEFEKLAKSLGGEPMIRNFDIVGRATEHMELLPEDIDEVYRPVISEPVGENGHYFPEDLPVCASCGAGVSKLSISSDGDIFPCQVMSFPEFKMGNIKDIDSIHDFLYRNEYAETDGFKSFLDIFPPYSSSCKDCPVKTHCTHCALYAYLMKNKSNFNDLCEMKKEGLMPIWS